MSVEQEKTIREQLAEIDAELLAIKILQQGFQMQRDSLNDALVHWGRKEAQLLMKRAELDELVGKN